MRGELIWSDEETETKPKTTSSIKPQIEEKPQPQPKPKPKQETKPLAASEKPVADKPTVKPAANKSTVEPANEPAKLPPAERSPSLGLKDVAAATPQNSSPKPKTPQKTKIHKTLPHSAPDISPPAANLSTTPTRNGRTLATIAGLSVIIVTAGITGFSLLNDSDVTTSPNVPTSPAVSLEAKAPEDSTSENTTSEEIIDSVVTEAETSLVITPPKETTPDESEAEPITPAAPKEPSQPTKTTDDNKAVVTQPRKARPAAAQSPVIRDVKMSADSILELQKNLGELGFYTTSLSGEIDAHTRRAIVEYRRAAALPPAQHVSSAIVETINLEAKTRKEEAKALLRAEKKREADAEARRIEDARLAAQQAEIARVAAEKKAIADAAIAAEAAKAAAEAAEAAKVVVVEASIKKRAEVKYPRGVSRDVEGKTIYVVLTFSVDENGRPVNLEATDTNASRERDVSRFSKAAKQGVSKFTFNPKTENGKAVLSEGHTLKVQF